MTCLEHRTISELLVASGRTSTAYQKRLVAQLEALGHRVTLEPAA